MLEDVHDSEQRLTILGALWRYELNGLLIETGGVPLYLQYRFGLVEYAGTPFSSMLSVILLIELAAVSSAIGILNRRFAEKNWSLRAKEGYIGQTIKGFVLIATTLILMSFSTPIYVQIWPPVPHPLGFELWLIFWTALLGSFPLGILARPVAFHRLPSLPSRRILLCKSDKRGIIVDMWQSTHFVDKVSIVL
jgi:hypothetical protein